MIRNVELKVNTQTLHAENLSWGNLTHDDLHQFLFSSDEVTEQ